MKMFSERSVIEEIEPKSMKYCKFFYGICDDIDVFKGQSILVERSERTRSKFCFKIQSNFQLK